MQTELTPCFDPDNAREASLTATLRFVRVRRRMRHTMRAAAAVALIIVPTVLLNMRPSSRGNPVVQNPLVVHTRPLAAEQIVRSTGAPGLRIRSSSDSGRTARISTQSDTVVPRLAEREFRQLLAVHDVGCIEVAGVPAQVLPLRGGASDSQWLAP